MSVNRILRGENFPVGFRFRPTDEELISHYLMKKINGTNDEVEIIPEVDMCRYEPCDLPGKSLIKSKDLEWFFFSPCQKKYPNGRRANRATMKGYWKATGKDREIKKRKNLIGMKKTLVFLNGKAPKGKRTPWIMHEYSATQNDLVGSRSGQGAYVICRLFYKPYDIVESPKNERIENENLAYDDEFDPRGQSPTQSSPMATESEPDVNIVSWLNDTTPERTPDTPMKCLNKVNIIPDRENSKADVATTQVGGQLLDQLQIDHGQLELSGSGGCPELGSGHSLEDSSRNDQLRVTQTLDTRSPVNITELLNEILEDDPDEHLFDQATSQTNPTTSILLSAPQSIPQSARMGSWSTQPGIPQSSSAHMDCWSTPHDIPQSAHMDCWSVKDSRSNNSYLGKPFIGDGQLYDQSEFDMNSNRPHSLLSDQIVGSQFTSATYRPDYLFNNLCEGSDRKISLFDNANAQNTGVASQSSQQQQLDNRNVENSSTGIVLQSRQEQLSNHGPLKQGLAPRRIRLQTRINITAAPVVDTSNEGNNATTDTQDTSMASDGAFCNYSVLMMKSEEENSDTHGSDRAETVLAEEVPTESNSGISKRLSHLISSKDDNQYSRPAKMVALPPPRWRPMAKAVGIQSCYHVWAGLLLVMPILGFGLWSCRNS